jgi:hypothetical protein
MNNDRAASLSEDGMVSGVVELDDSKGAGKGDSFWAALTDLFTRHLQAHEAERCNLYFKQLHKQYVDNLNLEDIELLAESM